MAYLKAGGLLADLSGFLLTCPEHDADLVNADYNSFLGRDPTPTELSDGVAILQGGGTPEDLAGTIFDSDVYNGLFPTDRAFVENLYFDILGRPGEAAGLSLWGNRLSAA